MKKTITTKNILRRIRMSHGDLPPMFVGMEFVRYVRDPNSMGYKDPDIDFAWSVYISHDPCHDDGKGYVDDRWTVIAFHRHNMLFRIIGRELPFKEANKIAKGLI